MKNIISYISKNNISLITIVIGLFWIKSGVEKIAEGTFVSQLNQTLEKFASNNPYPVVKALLLQTAIPHYKIFGELTQWGEIAGGVGLVIVSILTIRNFPRHVFLFFTTIVSFIGLIFLNIVFYLSAGWLSESTASINFLLGVIQSLLFINYIDAFKRKG